MIVYEFPEAAASCFSVLALEDWIGTGSSSDSKDALMGLKGQGI